jgi:hypothetical protein
MLPELEEGPAVVNVRTGKLRLCSKYWETLPEEIKRFIIYHETGHLNAGKSESAADDWAVKHYVLHGHSPQKAVDALLDVLPWDDIKKQQNYLTRIKKLLDKAKHYDFHYNGNTRLKL